MSIIINLKAHPRCQARLLKFHNNNACGPVALAIAILGPEIRNDEELNEAEIFSVVATIEAICVEAKLPIGKWTGESIAFCARQMGIQADQIVALAHIPHAVHHQFGIFRSLEWLPHGGFMLQSTSTSEHVPISRDKLYGMFLPLKPSSLEQSESRVLQQAEVDPASPLLHSGTHG